MAAAKGLSDRGDNRASACRENTRVAGCTKTGRAARKARACPSHVQSSTHAVESVVLSCVARDAAWRIGRSSAGEGDGRVTMPSAALTVHSHAELSASVACRVHWTMAHGWLRSPFGDQARPESPGWRSAGWTRTLSATAVMYAVSDTCAACALIRIVSLRSARHDCRTASFRSLALLTTTGVSKSSRGNHVHAGGTTSEQRTARSGPAASMSPANEAASAAKS